MQNDKLKLKKKSVIIIMGPPGSGKGTQAKLLCEKFKLNYIGAGDVLRNRQKLNDFTGKKLARVMGRGELVPDFIIIDLAANEFEKFKKNTKINGFVLDGWTRKIMEAMLINEALNWHELDKNIKVILINISARESYNRLTKRRQCKKCGNPIPWTKEFKNLTKCNKCGGLLITRFDDSKIQSIKKRLSEYKKETISAINYYKKQRRLIEIDGEQSIEDVFKDILRVLSS